MPKSKSKIPSILALHSIGELFRYAATNDRHALLAVAASENLGGVIILDSEDWLKNEKMRKGVLAQCRQWLEANANETSESGVVEEINFCRDLID